MKKKINSIPLLVTVCGHSVAFTECQARHGMCNIKSDLTKSCESQSYKVVSLNDINQQRDDSLCNKAHVSIMQCTLTENVLTAQISFFVQSTFKKNNHDCRGDKYDITNSITSCYNYKLVSRT